MLTLPSKYVEVRLLVFVIGLWGFGYVDYLEVEVLLGKESVAS